jgi:hypothetical protein
MTGVEQPDYWIYSYIASSICVALLVAAFKRLRKRGWFTNENDTKVETRARDKMEERIRAKFKRPGKISKRQAMWNQRPHLKESSHLCGFTKPGVWECRCGKRKCETFGKLCEAVGGVDATPPQKCGLRNPGEWECNCGGGLSGSCDARVRFNKGMENLGSSMTPVPPSPMERPVPDRKAAIAHSRKK